MIGGRRALVTGGDSGFGLAVAHGLAELGAELVALRSLRHAEGPVDVVVHADLDPFAFEPEALADTSAEDWQRRCEAVLRSALECAQTAHRLMHGAGGLLVFVTPTIGITGAAGLVPFATAVEGVRALAKSAARQWGSAGIRVNCVAPRAELLSPAAGRLSPEVAEPALGATPVDAGAVASVIALLVSAGSLVTGATVVVDGGVVMAP